MTSSKERKHQPEQRRNTEPVILFIVTFVLAAGLTVVNTFFYPHRRIAIWAAFVTIVVFIFALNWILNKNVSVPRRTRKLMGSISILASLGFMSAAIYFTFNPNINLEQPTFDEGIDTVVFTIGNDSQQESVAQLRAAKQRFFLGDIPAFLYVEGNKPYVDVDILTPPGEPPGKIAT